MNDAEKEAYQILRNVLWLNEEDHEELYEEFILAVSQALQKKHDEIERLNKIIAGIDVKNPDAVDVMIDAMKEQKEYIQSLKNKLRESEDEVERLRKIVQIPKTLGGEK